ncbi:uncharacterized protein N7518_004447 [Penicillium psychrosexuale]|uniref:uncharacterized protein n=1 Tax=Penicillium psychrosexuale TaxID=1002107 RepID=UPI002545474C|nr:uncharacterized protein N7518_004447 [Penicillium psychrosexuale]KAJ5795907.1 hypothetical protein N7518_004447 [Penicillium psychrosexuale]
MKGQNPINLDCLSVAPGGYIRNKAMVNCFVELQKQIANSACHESELYKFIASALLLDAYPPGMHQMIFDALYRDHCRDAWDEENSEAYCVNISDQFVESFTQLGPKMTSAAICRESLVRFYHTWGGLQSTTTCFSCMCRPPEHMLPYRHAICDTCVILFGDASTHAEYYIDLSECPICVRQLPPTKRPIVISLDGGGVRGVIQLGLLRAAGALSAIDITLNEVSAEESCAKFPAFARMIFRPSPKCVPKSTIPRNITWIKCLAGLLADC